MAHLMATQVKNVAEVVEATFDGYTVAAAHIMGCYDVDGDEVPARPEPDRPAKAERDAAADAELDELTKRQYL